MSSIFYGIRCLMHMLCHNKQCEINASMLLTSFTFLCQIIFTLFLSRLIRYQHNIYKYLQYKTIMTYLVRNTFFVLSFYRFSIRNIYYPLPKG